MYKIKNISWNINGILKMIANDATGLKTTTNIYVELITEITKIKPDIALIQEPIGTKFEGYSIKREWQFAVIPGMIKATADIGLTTIYIRDTTIKKYQPIPIPDDIFGEKEPINRIYASAVKVYIKNKHRDRDYIIYWTGIGLQMRKMHH